jgi:hypothetical protein
MGNYGEQQRAAAARLDLPTLIGSDPQVGLVLLDDDHREQPVIKGQVIQVGFDFVIFRHDGMDEEISLAMIAKRLQGDQTVVYGDGPGR